MSQGSSGSNSYSGTCRPTLGFTGFLWLGRRCDTVTANPEVVEDSALTVTHFGSCSVLLKLAFFVLGSKSKLWKTGACSFFDLPYLRLVASGAGNALEIADTIQERGHDGPRQ